MKRFLARMVNRLERLEKNDNIPMTLEYNSVFILGTGPSINKITEKEGRRLSQQMKIGVNGIYNRYKCDVYCCADKVYIERHYNEMFKHKCWFLFESAKTWYKKQPWNRKDWHTYTHKGNCVDWDNITFNIDRGCYSGNTVIIEAIQVAISLKCRHIYLLGVDLDYTKDSYFYGDDNPNPKYPEGREDIKPLVDAFAVVKRECDKYGIEIVNLNPDSKLNVFPKMSLKEVFKWRW